MIQSIGGVIGRVLGVFALIGAGLGAGALLFLWATDYFKPAEDGFGSAIIGGLTIAAVLIFALLTGVVVAAIGGMHAANVSMGRGGAMAAGLVAGSLGHIAMIAVLGGILIVGMQALSPSDREPAEESIATPTPDPVDPNCVENYGADSPLCEPEAMPLPDVSEDLESELSESESQDEIDVDQLIKLGLGFIPAAVVGALTAGLLYSEVE